MEEIKNEEEVSLGDEVTLFSLNAEVKLLAKECEELKEEIKFLKSGSSPIQNQQISKISSIASTVVESLISGLCGGALLMLILFFASNGENNGFRYTAGGMFLGAILLFAISKFLKTKKKAFLIINGILVFIVMMLFYVTVVTNM